MIRLLLLLRFYQEHSPARVSGRYCRAEAFRSFQVFSVPDWSSEVNVRPELNFNPNSTLPQTDSLSVLVCQTRPALSLCSAMSIYHTEQCWINRRPVPDLCCFSHQWQHLWFPRRSYLKYLCFKTIIFLFYLAGK